MKSIAASYSINKMTISVWPFALARCNAVHPSYSHQNMSRQICGDQVDCNVYYLCHFIDIKLITMFLHQLQHCLDDSHISLITNYMKPTHSLLWKKEVWWEKQKSCNYNLLWSLTSLWADRLHFLSINTLTTAISWCSHARWNAVYPF